jgi:hypothetical protein
LGLQGLGLECWVCQLAVGVEGSGWSVGTGAPP